MKIMIFCNVKMPVFEWILTLIKEDRLSAHNKCPLNCKQQSQNTRNIQLKIHQPFTFNQCYGYEDTKEERSKR